MERTNVSIAKNVLEKLSHVTPVIQEVLYKAITLARAFFEARDAEMDTYLFPDLVRYEAKCLFDSAKYRSIGYRFVVLSRNGLLLIYEHEGCIYNIRVRKADEDGELPTKNLSRTLKRFYNQPQPYIPGLAPEEIIKLVVPSRLNLIVVWDVDKNYILTDMSLACPKTVSGDVHFADKIEHAAKSISANAEFDDEPEELEDIDIQPFEKTGTEDDGEDDDQND